MKYLDFPRSATSRVFLGLVIIVVAVALFLLLVPQHVSAGGSGVYPPPASGDWIISSDTTVFNQNFKLRGNVIVQSGKSLKLDGDTVTMNSSVPNQYRIEVLAGGKMEILRTKLTAANMSLPYYMVVRKDARMTVTNSTLEGMGWKEALAREQYGFAVYSNNVSISGSTVRNSRVGLYVEDATPTVTGNNFTSNFRGAWFFSSSSVVLVDDTFHNNTWGLYTERSNVSAFSCRFIKNDNMGLSAFYSNVSLQGSSILGSYDIGIWSWNSNITMTDGVIDAATYDLYFEHDSHVTGYNASIDTGSIEFQDRKSTLRGYFSVDVRVLWWSNDGPVQNATVNITGQDGSEVANGTTGTDGMLRGLPLLGYDENYRELVFYNPFNFTVRALGLKGNTSASLKHSSLVNITIDDLPPSLKVTNPPMNGEYNKRLIDLRGVLWDNESGPAWVEVSIDGANYTKVLGLDLWNLTITLKDGKHNLSVRGWDLAGNNRTVKYNLTVDTVPPLVTIKSPKNGLRTNKTLIWVNGTAEKGCNLTLGGKILNNTNGNWGLYWPLVEGPNNITVKAMDKAGNIALAYINVTRDTMVDPLVLEPVNGTRTNQINFTLKGTTEIGTFVRVMWEVYNGTGANRTLLHKNLTTVSDAKGAFKFSLRLQEGLNNLTLYARDTLNNTKTLNLSYSLDSIPPTLVITSPKTDPYYTNKNGVNIKGRTEANATVFLGGQELELYDLQFTIRVEVFLGPNNFTIWARDNAGNIIRINLTIIVDKTPPLLNVSRPYAALSKTTDTYYTVTGFTEPNATLSINGIYYSVGFDGRFGAKRSLAFGGNTIVITAKDQAGNTKSVQRIIMREKPPPDMTMIYIGYSIPFIVLAALVGIVVFYMYKTGRLKKFQQALRKRKEAKDKIRASEEDGAPPKVTASPKPSDEQATIPGVPKGPSYDEVAEEAKEEDTEDGIEEMEEADEAKEGEQ
jgi:parallel beta-helix repeat protein